MTYISGFCEISVAVEQAHLSYSALSQWMIPLNSMWVLQTLKEILSGSSRSKQSSHLHAGQCFDHRGLFV